MKKSSNCKLCKTALTEDNQYKSWRGRCKECVKVGVKSYYTKNKEKVLEYKYRYQVENREHLREYHRTWRETNKEEVNAYFREYHKNSVASKKDYRKDYKKTFLVLMEVQNGKCAICLSRFSKELKAEIDHSHETGKTRGLLCHRCNSKLKEDNAFNPRAVYYLESQSSENLPR